MSDATTNTGRDFEKLQDQYGFTREQLSSLYSDAKAEKDKGDMVTEKEKLDLEKAKSESNQFELGEGEARYVYDPETGTAKQIAARSKTFAPKGSEGPDTAGTSLSYSDANYTLDSIRKSKGGRYLTQGELKPITDIQTIVGQCGIGSQQVLDRLLGYHMRIGRDISVRVNDEAAPGNVLIHLDLLALAFLIDRDQTAFHIHLDRRDFGLTDRVSDDTYYRRLDQIGQHLGRIGFRSPHRKRSPENTY
jgi:hypothetical protein